MPRQRRASRAGFTLIQLLVLLALLLFVLSVLLPLIARIRQAAVGAESRNNLKQMALAAHNFHDVNNRFPPTIGTVGNATGTAHFYLLPYLEQETLYREAKGAVWKNGVNGTRVAIFVDRLDESAPPGNRFKDWLGTTNYAVNWLVFKTGEMRINNITDGTSNTFMIAQRYQVCDGVPTAWGYPALYTWTPMFAYYSDAKFQSAPKQADCDPTLPQSIQGNAIHVALCDGSVRTFSPNLSSESWRALTTPAGGEIIGNDLDN